MESWAPEVCLTLMTLPAWPDFENHFLIVNVQFEPSWSDLWGTHSSQCQGGNLQRGFSAITCLFWDPDLHDAVEWKGRVADKPCFWHTLPLAQHLSHKLVCKKLCKTQGTDIMTKGNTFEVGFSKLLSVSSFLESSYSLIRYDMQSISLELFTKMWGGALQLLDVCLESSDR